MLKTLLEERFKLAAHREIRTIPGYALAVGKDGLKIQEVEPGEGKRTPREPDSPARK
jgi:uncharacterized protein (TIGR03435 family)